jgi:hypothetical protein
MCFYNAIIRRSSRKPVVVLWRISWPLVVKELKEERSILRRPQDPERARGPPVNRSAPDARNIEGRHHSDDADAAERAAQRSSRSHQGRLWLRTRPRLVVKHEHAHTCWRHEQRFARRTPRLAALVAPKETPRIRVGAQTRPSARAKTPSALLPNREDSSCLQANAPLSAAVRRAVGS